MTGILIPDLPEQAIKVMNHKQITHAYYTSQQMLDYGKLCVENFIQYGPGQVGKDIDSRIDERVSCQKTFYCHFLPLGLWCSFGASNIHHAYNKAIKLWGAKQTTELQPREASNNVIKTERLSVYPDLQGCARQVISQPMMTALIKTWRDQQ